MGWRDVSNITNYLNSQIYVTLHMNLFTSLLSLYWYNDSKWKILRFKNGNMCIYLFLKSFLIILQKNLKKRERERDSQPGGGHCQMKNTVSFFYGFSFSYSALGFLLVVISSGVRRHAQVYCSQPSLWNFSWVFRYKLVSTQFTFSGVKTELPYKYTKKIIRKWLPSFRCL